GVPSITMANAVIRVVTRLSAIASGTPELATVSQPPTDSPRATSTPRGKPSNRIATALIRVSAAPPRLNDLDDRGGWRGCNIGIMARNEAPLDQDLLPGIRQ